LNTFVIASEAKQSSCARKRANQKARQELQAQALFLVAR
jgi:hypothetical protein